MRFGRALGANAETLTGLSGLGDTILSCATPQSRNFSFGLALGRGLSPLEALGNDKLAEGVFTASVLNEMARDAGVEMPVMAAVADVVEGKASVDDVIGRLLARPVRAEV
jgi:glycerol-3-phosphate dehydrogenase (NAD(P)+)